MRGRVRNRSLRSRRWPLLALPASLAFILLLTSCSSRAETTGTTTGSGAQASADSSGRGRGRGGGGSGAAVAVTTATVVEREMPVSLHAIGNVEASSTVDVRAQVSGELVAIGFEEGHDVTAGQILFTLDARPFDVALKQAEAQVAKDTSQQRNVDTQRARAANLLKAGLIAQADYDTINAQANSLQGTIAADNAQVESARLQLQYTKIAAPVSGRTGALLVHKGALIRANDATPLVVINQLAPAAVSFAVPAASLPAIRANSKLHVEATPSGSTASPAVGSVSFVDNAVDPTSNTIRLKAMYPNGDHRLWPGQFVEVNLLLSVEPHAIVVPSAAVLPGQQGTYVFVAKPDQMVESRQVTVVRTHDTDSVIGSGLRAGDVVVTDGQLGLISGTKVFVRPPVGTGPAKRP